MFKKIMVPVDLNHADKLQKALNTAADLANHYGATICYVGVTAATPGAVAHNPEEFGRKLAAFADEQAGARGVKTESKPMTSHDPAVDLDDTLMEALEQTGCDLVVMATHVPNISDYLWSSNGGRIANHTRASVFLVRD
ncbi:universal stress protein [Minwuia thermotolerans]|uniref:Universal stress protein UspA n=1 Tax=Minwuia thermotolerans TaxID=2056226 RepID=A0A2M9FXW2_9PROT|nr:universal stress protein [Minwuia thermotolerans]PJK28297.1 universal stress protein UspA [Minwuia thermotolerans]